MLHRTVKHALIALALLTVAVCTPSTASADCTSPAGVEGNMVYNSSSHVLQYCDNTDVWRSMGSAPGTETDPQVGTLTAPDFCTTDGSAANCTTAAINLASQVTGNLPYTNFNSGTGASSTTFWRGDGGWAALNITETDPQVGTLTACAYCRANSGATALDCVYQAATPSITLVGWWKFDDGSGTAPVDSSGHSYTGTTVNTPTWTTGHFNGALSFASASSQYVKVDNIVMPENDFTWTIWLKPASTATELYIMEMQSPNDLEMSMESGGDIQVISDSGANSSSTATLSTSSWNHVALRRKGKILSTWINGVKDTEYDDSASGTNGIYDFHSSGCPFIIGTAVTGVCPSATYSLYWNGLIDDARVYNGALTDSQITDLYNGTDPTPTCP